MILDVKHYSELISAHSLFVQNEGRYRFHYTYMEHIDGEAWMRGPDAPLKEVLLLFGWVHGWDPNFKGDMTKFLGIFSQLFPILYDLRRQSIVSVSLDSEAKGALQSVFDQTAQCCRDSRYESTDASKLLHGILPELFVMWDNRIRIGMQRHGVTSTRDEGKRGYNYAFEYLPAMQDVGRRVADSYVDEHGGDCVSACQALKALADGHTVAKMIDEYNYLEFTCGVRV